MKHPAVAESAIEVIVARDCPMCAYSYVLIDQALSLRPDASITVTDRSDATGEVVIATPTFRVNGRTVGLGNPDLAELLDWIDEGVDDK